MKLYRHPLGGLFAITSLNTVLTYNKIGKCWKKSAWNGDLDKLLPELKLVGNNFRRIVR
ncbi:hypothetical protein [Ralstonia phage Reminis]|uniref:Uncharacterized protein n=1 Tax=Ralstonia phage Reminis TaxID=2662139 RepID=A0A5Q2UAL2_9CAUD|nr:hypothetical protein [Ralstonia phage Reminis]